MNARKLDAQRIFQVARTMRSPEILSEYLDQTCGDDDVLRARVEELLAAADARSDTGIASTIDRPGHAANIGQQFGRYKLLDKLGEGGMGTVFMAEQLRPVKRRVAVKIIKQDLASEHYVARFEAERQALALMDHPNIAHVFDGGCIDTGQPYFVMELVRGIPITQFCDQNRKTVRERLELFAIVCRAVQHAHQKGIIHRDLKPSNVLVTVDGDVPVPKIIDFGVAKAQNQQLTERTLFTQAGQIVGTWEYMSPEQAISNQLDVDTRTDVYSLGVILYELLTGVTPLESKQLRSATLEETLRMIREHEPARPSTRLTMLGKAGDNVARYCGTDVNSLAKALRGDIDCIVMKALEKDRTHRYETASAFEADVQRFLNSEAIEARPPSAGYRLRKLAARHRVALIATGIVAVTLFVATITSTLLAWRAVRAGREATESLEKAQNILFDKVLMDALSGDITLTKESLKDVADVRLEQAWQEFAIAVTYTWNGESDKARAAYARTREYDLAHKLSFAIKASEMQVSSSDRDFYANILELRNQTPAEDFEYIFRVQAEAWFTPSVALEALEKCGVWRTSTLAQYFGAMARINQALLDLDQTEADAAVATFQHLLRRYPGNKLPLSGLLYTSLSARNIALYHGQDERVHLHELCARQAAEKLARAENADVFWAIRSRAWFFAECGEGERAMAEWENRTKKKPLGVDPMHYAACCCLFGDDAKRRQVLAALPASFGADNGHARLAKAYLTASLRRPRLDVKAACNDLLALDDPRREMQCGTVEVWLAYGDFETARAQAMALLDVDGQEPECNAHWDLFLRYVTGELEEDQFIADFEHLNPPMFQVKAEYFVGLKALAERNLNHARRCFDVCRRSGRVFASWYWWSKVFLKRLDDPAWKREFLAPAVR